MKPEKRFSQHQRGLLDPDTILVIQASLPGFLHTLPKLTYTSGRGSGRQGPSPTAPREKE